MGAPVDNIIEILKALGTILLASSPGIYSLINQHSKDKKEKAKRDLESEKLKVDTAEKVQEIYQEMLNDLKKEAEERKMQSDDNKKRIEALEEESFKIRGENERLKQDNREFMIQIQEQSEEIRVLKEKVGKLIDQIKGLGIVPVVDVTRPIKYPEK